MSNVKPKGKKRGRDDSSFPPPSLAYPLIKKPKKDRDHNQIKALNNAMTDHSRRKEVAQAMKLFHSARTEGTANSFTYAIAINANVDSGFMDEAIGLYTEMKGPAGFTPTVVTYTTMIKGYCERGQLHAAASLLREMASSKDSIPNIRTANTFLRGCAKLGQVAPAMAVVKEMSQWHVEPDVSTVQYCMALLSQALRTKIAVSTLESSSAIPGVSTNGGLFVSLAKAYCLRGEYSLAKAACLRARAALDAEAAEPVRVDEEPTAVVDDKKVTGGKRGFGDRGTMSTRVSSHSMFASHRRHELAQDLSVLHNFLAAPMKGKDLVSCFHRLVVLPLQHQLVESSHADLPTLAANFLIDNCGFEDVVLRTISLGGEARRRALADAVEGVASHFRGCLTKTGQLKLRNLFDGRARPDASMAIKLEICSGSGEWAVAQAAHDLKNLWVTLEVRIDRVYETFTRAVFQGVTNLATLGGDAVVVLDKYLEPGQVSHVFVNHPEPPVQRPDEADLTAESDHLLKASFFSSMHDVLLPGGLLTIVTDSRWYARLLLSIVAGSEVRDLFRSKRVASKRCGLEVMEECAGVEVLEGEPGPLVGHMADASSYFDKLKRSEKSSRGLSLSRYILILEKV